MFILSLNMCELGRDVKVRALSKLLKYTNHDIKIYKNRDHFWNSLELSGLLSVKNIIIAGDLNFALSLVEVLGSSSRLDQLVDYFSNLFQRVDIVDVDPIKLEPTSSNDRGGEVRVCKRIDRFLMNLKLIQNF